MVDTCAAAGPHTRDETLDRALADCRQGFSCQRMVDNSTVASYFSRRHASAIRFAFLKPKSPLKFFVFQQAARQRYSLALYHPNYRTSMLEGRRLPCVKPTRCRYPSPSAPHAACLPPAACESEGWVRAARACIRA